eukprot:578861-Heterocapsa_arctica.AAC.1
MRKLHVGSRSEVRRERREEFYAEPKQEVAIISCFGIATELEYTKATRGKPLRIETRTWGGT